MELPFKNWRRNLLSSLKERTSREEETSSLFLQNGGALLEGLVASTNGRSKIPIRNFSAEELVQATGDFANHVLTSNFRYMCIGSWRGRSVLVKRVVDSASDSSDHNYDALSGAIRDVVITSQMSHHKNILKLIGCCQEFDYPALVYEHVGTQCLLDLLLPDPEIENCRSLTWTHRLQIASDIASTILYLHTAFDTPIIYRVLNPRNIVVDQRGVAKLFGFSFSIALPLGKLEVKDDVIGVIGYLDPEYSSSGLVTQKTDVYSFGVLLLVLLTGKQAIINRGQDDCIHIVEYVNDYVGKNQLNEIVDPSIADDTRETLQQQQLHALLNTALRCAQYSGQYRPSMIDVAKELRRIRKYFLP